jgi:AmmeMemoRadiSam system protein B
MAIREAAVAGMFYPGDAGQLKQTIESYAVEAKPATNAKAVVVPHAGYIYSGAVAAEALASAQLPKRFIILGPNHSGRGAELALSPADAWRTPLGVVDVDREMNRELIKLDPDVREDALAHVKEHSIEVQIPIIQALAGSGFKFSAICVGTVEYAKLEALGHAMAKAIQTSPEPVLMIASSDMTHYEDAASAQEKDKFAIDQMTALNPEGLYRTVLENGITMCGFAPAVAVLTACRDLGASSGTPEKPPATTPASSPMPAS